MEECCEFEEDDEETDEDEMSGPHPLMERISAIAAEETDPDRSMWLMDSLEEFVRAQRFKVCLDDVVYRALAEGYFFTESMPERAQQQMVQEVEKLLDRIRVEERQIHHDRLGPGGTKQISGVRIENST